jgi:AcrR family transcriptional regulator
MDGHESDPGTPRTGAADKPPSRTERRRAETRRRLLEAGQSVIGERGVAGLRITDVTERADVALGSFYNHFSSKEELVDEVVRLSLAAIVDSVLETTPPDGDPAEIIAASIRRFVNLAREDPEFARVVVHLDHADVVFIAAVEPAARDAISHGLASGRFTVPDLDTAVITLSAGAMALIRAILEGRHTDPDGPAHYATQSLVTLGVPLEEARALAFAPADA